MSIKQTLTRGLNSYAVYWGAPTDMGDGLKIFNDPIEIRCRWETREQIMVYQNGEKNISRSIVYVDRDVDENGYLYDGRLADLDDFLDSSAGTYIDPFTITLAGKVAHIIKRFEKVPDFKGVYFLRRAQLTPWLT